MNVWLDSDGVLANFNSKIVELIGKPIDQFPTPKEGWKALNPHQHVFAEPDKMPDADRLVSGVMMLKDRFHFNVGVLTAVPLVKTMPFAEQDKREWFERNYPELAKNFRIGPHAIQKQDHCNPGDVLIDDNRKNIDQWNDKGGVGIFHTNARDSINMLRYYLEMKK